MDPKLLKALASGDVDAASEWIEQEEDPQRVLAMYAGAINHLYWAQKDVASVVALGRMAIDSGLRRARDAHGEIADRLRLAANMIAYDVSSFTWPGWAEPGVEITPDVMLEGERYAALVLELAEALGRPHDALARANWIVGAHHLAAGRHGDATSAFDASAEHGRAHDDDGLELLALGYGAIARNDQTDLNEVIDRIRTVEHGDEFAQQLETARDVFCS